MVAVKESPTANEELRQMALDHLWMNSRSWTEMAELGEPNFLVEGDGVRVRDVNGRWWLDVNGGYMSVHAGYGRTEIADAAYEQMKRLPYMANTTTAEPTARLAAKLAEITPGSLTRSYFVSGGSEANESALKIARAYQQRVGAPGRHLIVSRRGSYHGALGQTLWLGGMPGNHREDYGPAYPGMVYGPQPLPYRCEFGGQTPSECAVLCAQAIERLIEFHGPDSVCAVIAEPVASPVGVAVPGDEYWPMLREICTRYGVVLIADEVVTGFGRTGKMFAVEHWGVTPDIMTVAKGIVSSYLPIGAAIATEEVASAFAGGPTSQNRQLNHTLTFSGHPVAAAAALKNIEVIESDDLVANSAETGKYLLESAQELKEKHPVIGDVRGLGLYVAVDLVKDRETKEQFGQEDDVGARIGDKMAARSMIFRGYTSSMSIGPPLCATRADIDEIVTGLDETFGELCDELGV